MYKKLQLKNFRIFLKSNFPENIYPLKKWYKKDQKKLLVKKKFFSLRKKIKEAEQELLNQYTIALDLEKKTLPIGKVIKKNLLPIFKKNFYFILNKEKIKNPHLKKKHNYFLLSLDNLKYELSKKGGSQTRASDFHLQLKERKKLSILYGGISSTFLRQICIKSNSFNLLLFLERRLDVILYRLCFFPTIKAARQAISHNRIQINGDILNVSSYLVKPGDIISVIPTHRQKVQNALLKVIKSRLLKKQKRFFISPLLFLNIENPLLLNKLKAINLNSKSNIKNLLSLKKNITKYSQNKCILLRLKKCFYKNRSRLQILSTANISIMKPVNMEVSYKLFTAIMLFFPQKIAYPALIDSDLIKRSLN